MNDTRWKKTRLNFSSLVFTLNKWMWERATMTMKKCFDSRSSSTRSECVILTLCTPKSRQVFACLLRAAITCELSRLNQSASIWLGENFHMRRSSYDRRSEMKCINSNFSHFVKFFTRKGERSSLQDHVWIERCAAVASHHQHHALTRRKCMCFTRLARGK